MFMMKAAIQALYPPRPAAVRRRSCRSSSSPSYEGGRGTSFHETSLPQFEGRGSDTVSLPRSSSHGSSTKRRSPSRFSELLLEHGEKDLHQDWSVCASSSMSLSVPLSPLGDDGGGASRQMKQMEGRLRVCSRSIVFEPRQASKGIFRLPFRYMTVCPFLGGNGADSNAPHAGILDGDITALNGRDDSIGNGASWKGASVVVRCKSHVVMKANNEIGPYQYVQVPVQFRFLFLHSSPTSMLSLAKQLFDLEAFEKRPPSVSFAPSIAFDSSAPPIIPLPSTSDSRDAIIDQFTSPAMNRSFDTTNFLHAQEQPITPNLLCSMKMPLLEEKGCAILTACGLYFQPMVASAHVVGNGDLPQGNKFGPGAKAYVWLIDDVRAIARRYDGMKDRGMEIYLANQHSVLLAFESAAARERVVRLLSQRISTMRLSPLPCYTDRSFVESALELWQADQIDNFEYLLCLNSAAGRSFLDLSRYPVFPWVLTSYGEWNHGDFADELPTILDFTDPNIFRDLSKPIGALSDKRFEDFRMRYESMVQQQKGNAPQTNQDAPFMYGTHYSAPGYVLFYLLRVMPECMLCLQNGKFDIPDRLFHSVDATYRSILTNPADLKELIPEFFDPDCFDFLTNSMGLQLGNLQTGQRVDDVILPPWAKSAKHFLRQNRAALESEYCTKNLPKWIDLIFGGKSRGSGAKNARNLFHPSSYIGPEDLGAIHSPEDRTRAKLQSAEFGIVPDQLFCRGHPCKNESFGGLGDADTLLTHDCLRESYRMGDDSVFSALALTKDQRDIRPSGFSLGESLAQNENSSPAVIFQTNPFD